MRRKRSTEKFISDEENLTCLYYGKIFISQQNELSEVFWPVFELLELERKRKKIKKREGHDTNWTTCITTGI